MKQRVAIRTLGKYVAACLVGALLPMLVGPLGVTVVLCLALLASSWSWRLHRSAHVLMPVALVLLVTATMIVAQPLRRLYMHQAVSDLPSNPVTLGELQALLKARGIRVHYPEEVRDRVVTLPKSTLSLSQLMASVKRQTAIEHSPGDLCGTNLPMVNYPSRINIHVPRKV
ncbi:MAG TPA: hypothetical protein VFC25_06975 [Verrucomicrobiae bacterium]|nr:hypothetical protein [Verrucomicrobiae bacterium]